MKNQKDFLILDQQLAGLLMLKKNRLVTARPDKNNKTKNVFFFDYNDKFERDFEFLKQHKKEIEEFIDRL